jgi:hypothetical protein
MCFKFFKDSKDFSNFASGCQSTLIGLSILAAGIWTLFTYCDLRVSETAKLKTDEIGRNLNHYSLNIFVNAKQTKSPIKKNKGILIDVILENMGSQDIVIDLTEVPPITATRLNISGAGKYLPEEIYTSNLYVFAKDKEGNYETKRIEEKLVQSNSKKQLVFYIDVNSDGLFHIEFMAKAAKEIQNKYEETKRKLKQESDKNYRLVWGANTFILIN